MNTITRLSIAPLLVVCVTVLGCAVFPGNQQEPAAPSQQEQSTAKIILPTKDDSGAASAIESPLEPTGTATFRGLPTLANTETSPASSTPVLQDQSLAANAMSSAAKFEPAEREKEEVIRADRIEFVEDSVPFGNRLRAASHLAAEPVSTANPADEAAIAALGPMSISDTVGGNIIAWPIGTNLPTVQVRAQKLSLDFEDPSAGASLKMLIEVGGELYDKDAKPIVRETNEYLFSGAWATGDIIHVTVGTDAAIDILTVANGPKNASTIVKELIAALKSQSDVGLQKITWGSDSLGTSLVATADVGRVAFNFKFSVTPPGNATRTFVKSVDEAHQPIPNGVNSASIKGLPEGETVGIRVWIDGEITSNTENLTPFRSFSVTTPSPNNPFAPVIAKVANAEFIDPGNFADASELFYGNTPFIRIEGQNGKPGELSFLVRDNSGKLVDSSITNLKVETINGSLGTWKAEFNLSKPLSGTVSDHPQGFGQLFVLRDKQGKHNYSFAPLKFNTTAFDPNLKNPVITQVEIDSSRQIDVANDDVIQINKTEFSLKGTLAAPTTAVVVATTNGGQTVLGAVNGASTWTIPIKGLREGRQDIVVDLMQGDEFQRRPVSLPVFVRAQGPKITSVEPSSFGTSAGVTSLTVTFDPNNPLKEAFWTSFTQASNLTAKTFSIFGSKGSGVFVGNQFEKLPTGITLNQSRNSVVLEFGGIPADIYQLQVKGADIEDVFGNNLVGDGGAQGTLYTKVLGGDVLAAGGLAPKFKADDSPTINTGISGTTGEFVPFPEFVRRPDVPDGFNPNDKVETRVVRLYYYRDAHRIAQIVNRKVKSFNRAAVDTNRQLADKARNQANQLTVARQNAERNAIMLANKTRQQENELQRLENSLNGALQQTTNYRREKPDADPVSDPMIQQLQSLVNSLSTQVNDKRTAVQDSREREVQANEQSQRAEAQEKLGREEQFRREVAAAHSDPDTYAAANLESVDPVEQVSVSVVGEGLIQLRGPLKGINLIRTAIDQLDSPVGQVRVSLHTVQINGERADRMEVVAKQVQTYIDHARFLTMQSSEMLRKAVVQVASRKAEEASALYPGDSQMERDQRYIVAFFGKDFIDELRMMDSEFLHTGNKLLSLHSMDTTSLASALNLMALAKNSTRQEIFAVFDEMVQTDLPQKEMSYFQAGWTCPKKKKNCFHRCKDCQPEFCPMACNANFESLRGFFDMQISNDDTMTPLQREFIRLAQIFKSRLITELEYKQRVMERAIIEERLGNREDELRAAIQKEATATKKLDDLENVLVAGQVELITTINALHQELWSQAYDKLDKVVRDLSQVEDLVSLSESRMIPGERKTFFLDGSKNQMTASMNDDEDFVIEGNKVDRDRIVRVISDAQKNARDSYDLLKRLYDLQDGRLFEGNSDVARAWQQFPRQLESFNRIFPSYVKNNGQLLIPELVVDFLFGDGNLTIGLIKNVRLIADRKPGGAAFDILENIQGPITLGVEQTLAELAKGDSDGINAAFRGWYSLRGKKITPLINSLALEPSVARDLTRALDEVDVKFREFLSFGVQLQIAERNATNSRRPLDHKKFLDMLVDELEEKYIELLDGTRAQVANIDNYLKRVTTALDDDFNTQFYYPAFKYIRESSVSYDVQFGQTETTTLLANNREFAKADPSASMEFDLPPRDILLVEGINGAKALMSDVGALANDPTFLAMAQLKGPGSTAAFSRGASGGNGVVRNVIPGLGGSTSEQVMSQNSNGGQQFGSNLENLIPDPAVYKFETGTGFEIRPVIQPDGQAVVFDFNYMYTTQIREPVRADEKHLGRVKRHFVDTDVQLSNFELREVSRYTVALKAARTAKGVPLFEDIPGVGVLFRPLPSDENSLQQNLIMAQATIFPTLFDLMGLRWAPVVSDLDPMRLSDSDFIVRNRRRMLENRVYDESSAYVDKFLRVPDSERRMDLYRSQDAIPNVHPNGYFGPGMNLQDSQMQEGYQPNRVYPAQPFVPGQSIEGATNPPYRRPALEKYDEQRSTAPPNPNGIREPFQIVHPRSR